MGPLYHPSPLLLWLKNLWRRGRKIIDTKVVDNYKGAVFWAQQASCTHDLVLVTACPSIVSAQVTRKSRYREWKSTQSPTCNWGDAGYWQLPGEGAPPSKGLFLWKATHPEIYEHHKLNSVDLKLEEEKIQRWVNREGAVLSEPIVQNSQRTTQNEKNRKYTSQ